MNKAVTDLTNEELKEEIGKVKNNITQTKWMISHPQTLPDMFGFPNFYLNHLTNYAVILQQILIGVTKEENARYRDGRMVEDEVAAPMQPDEADEERGGA